MDSRTGSIYSVFQKEVFTITKHWTEDKLKEYLAGLTIIIDSREQRNEHIRAFFDKNNIPYVVRKLDSGDYSAMLGDMTLEHDVFLERKNSLTELCGNMGQNRDRFNNEFTRAKAIGAKPFLLIENNTTDDVLLGNYRSQFNSKSLWASICTWMVRYNTTVMFCDKRNSGRIIYSVLYYYAREALVYE